MSGFAIIFDASNQPVDPAGLERIMKRMTHRGPDGRDDFAAGHLAMGHWHFWTTPEEVGEKQPLKLPGLPFRIVFDGRLDNRPDLLHLLDLDDSNGRVLSDAAIVLHAYARWGRESFAHFIGEFALVIVDEAECELIAGRDPLGERGLYYSIAGSRIVIASEPWAVAGVCGSQEEINEIAVVRYFALKDNYDGATFFTGVTGILPAQGILFNSSGIQKWRYWQPDLSKKNNGKSDEEYADGFLEKLTEAVRCRMRSNYPPAVMMSGGLDSTSIAALAARMLAPACLTTISYVFDELTECDERRYITEMQAQYDLNSIQLPGDEQWPYRDFENWPHNPNLPDGNPYRLLIETTYRRAEQEGIHILLTGHFGDHLYDGAEDWLADLILEKRLNEALSDLRLHLRVTGVTATLASGYMRRALVKVLLGAPLVSRPFKELMKVRRLNQARTLPQWLTPFSTNLLKKNEVRPSLDLANKNNLLGVAAADDEVIGTFFASQHNFETRNPYRDRRLVEYALTLPAYQLYRQGELKHVLRIAMRGILPEIVRGRKRQTTFVSLLSRGRERDKINSSHFIDYLRSSWCKYVRPEWVQKTWNMPDDRDLSGPEATIPRFCIGFQAWIERGFRRGYH